MTAPVSDERWRDFAACRDVVREDGHYGRYFGGNGDGKRYCVECPVAFTCLRYAVDEEIVHGTWGGMNEEERRKFLRSHPRMDAAAAVTHARHIHKIRARTQP